MKNITCPPASKLADVFRLDDETAKKLRAKIKAGYSKPRGEHWSHSATAWMDEVSDIAGFFETDSLYPDYPEIIYCNAGDTYAPTLIFNHDTAQVRIGCWGDIVENRRPAKALW